MNVFGHFRGHFPPIKERRYSCIARRYTSWRGLPADVFPTGKIKGLFTNLASVSISLLACLAN